MIGESGDSWLPAVVRAVRRQEKRPTSWSARAAEGKELTVDFGAGTLITDGAPQRKGGDDWDSHGTEGKANLTKTMQDYMVVMDSLGLCKFLIRGYVDPKEVVSWLNVVSGWGLSAEELMKRGEDTFNLKRRANQRLGVSRKDDILPPRLLAHDRATGGAAGSLPHLGKMLGEYYKLRNWTLEGVAEHSKHLMRTAATPNPTLA